LLKITLPKKELSTEEKLELLMADLDATKQLAETTKTELEAAKEEIDSLKSKVTYIEKGVKS